MYTDDTRFDHALELLAGVENFDDLQGALQTVRVLYGVANLGYHALQIRGLGRAELPLMATCDPAWLKRYSDREFVEIDPVAKASRQTDLPIDWATVDRSSTDAKRYFLELSRFDIGRQGMGIPLHGTRGDAIFTFTADIEDDAEWRSFHRRNRRDLFVLAYHFHDKAVTLAKGDPQKAVLSRQERNCLELSAQGHNAQAIADSLGLSVHTARMHLSRAQKRLNAHSRTEAVAKALGQGLIRVKMTLVALALAAAEATPLFEIPVLFV